MVILSNPDCRIHYAVQVCDTASREVSHRYAHQDRSIISKKSIASLLHAIEQATQNRPGPHHYVGFITDRCSKDLITWLQHRIANNTNLHMHLEIINLAPQSGIADSIYRCWQWLQQHGKDIVFQVQDDYLFESQSIIQSIDMQYTILKETGHHAVIQPFNDYIFWLNYQYFATPRTVFVGESTYWIQIYDTSCSFMTTHAQFSKHWDLYHIFLDLCVNNSTCLESKSLNLLFTERGVLGITPMATLSHHLQTTPDPHKDWKSLWNSTAIDLAPLA